MTSKRKKRYCVDLCVAAGLFLAGSVFVFVRYAGSTVKPSLERTIHPSVASDNPLLDVNGMTQETRFRTPEGYTRTEVAADSLAAYLRQMELLPNGNPIVTYDGDELNSACSGVYALDIGAENLQQCADSIIRVYSEYYWSRCAYDKIAFHLTNGDLMRYTDWRDGKRLVAAGSFSAQLKLRGENDSYECFRAYLESVMNYAGTKSLTAESTEILESDLRAGDMLVQGGSPGHAILVVDVAENEAGERCFLLAQGYMPAQSFHVLENNAHRDDPWFYDAELSGTVTVDGRSFGAEGIRRWQDGF